MMLKPNACKDTMHRRIFCIILTIHISFTIIYIWLCLILFRLKKTNMPIS